MKKLLLLFSFIIFSCASEENEIRNYTEEDIIGEWRLNSTVYVYPNGETEDQQLEDCADRSILNFKRDNTLTFSALDENCDPITEETENWEWEYAGEGDYNLYDESGSEFDGSLEGNTFKMNIDINLDYEGNLDYAEFIFQRN